MTILTFFLICLLGFIIAITISLYLNEVIHIKFYIIIPKKHPELDYITSGKLYKKRFVSFDSDVLNLSNFDVIPLEYCDIEVRRKDLDYNIIKNRAIELLEEIKGD